MSKPTENVGDFRSLTLSRHWIDTVIERAIWRPRHLALPAGNLIIRHLPYPIQPLFVIN